MCQRRRGRCRQPTTCRGERINYHERDNVGAFCNLTFTELAEVLAGNKTNEDVDLPAHWQGRLLPGSIPRVGFVTDPLATYLGLEKHTNPPDGEPLFLFQGSGLWAQNQDTRTAFHEDRFIQLVIPCHGAKLWHLSASNSDLGQIRGMGPWIKSPNFKKLMDFAWDQSGPLHLCANDTSEAFWSGYPGGKPPSVNRCTISPGDLLYLPYAYGHDVEATTSSMHITFRFTPAPQFTLDERAKSLEFQQWARRNRPQTATGSRDSASGQSGSRKKKSKKSKKKGR